MRIYKGPNFKLTYSESFYKSILEAIDQMSPDQDEIEIPESGGQKLVKAGSAAAKKRAELIEKADCSPFRYDGQDYLICVK